MADPLPLYPWTIRQALVIPGVLVTRPADTTAYTAGDVIATAGGLSSIGYGVGRVPFGGGAIVGAIASTSADQPTRPLIELLIFDQSPAQQNDNTPFSVTDAEAANFLGKITFDTWVSAAAGNLISHGVLQQPIGFKCKTAAAAVWGVPRIMNAYTPVASESFTFRLEVRQD